MAFAVASGRRRSRSASSACARITGSIWWTASSNDETDALVSTDVIIITAPSLTLTP